MAVTATIVRDILYSFLNICIRLIVGISSSALSPNYNIYLGDIMVSSRNGGKGRVF
jgi:hypothetical protein